MAYKITKPIIDVSQKDVVKITGEGATQLANSLIQEQSKTLEELSSDGVTIELKDITVSSGDSVEIRNADFYKEVLNKVNFDTDKTEFLNISCANIFC